MSELAAWYDVLPQDLLARAYRAGAELAWRRADAAQAVALAEAAGWPVIGVDIWLATEGGPTIPTPFVYDWSAGQAGGRASDFIRGFAWEPGDTSHGGREPWFNVVVGDAPGAALGAAA